MANRSVLYAIIAVVVIVIVGAVAYILVTQPSTPSTPTANITITIYAGEISGSQYGFGNASNALTAPGPTFTVPVGDVVKVTLINSGTMGHAWALLNAKGGSEIFGAAIGTANDPISPGSSGSVTFTASTAGTYYYLCPVDAHEALGMYGTFIVS